MVVRTVRQGQRLDGVDDGRLATVAGSSCPQSAERSGDGRSDSGQDREATGPRIVMLTVLRRSEKVAAGQSGRGTMVVSVATMMHRHGRTNGGHA
jgi:hypothetical protein